MSEEKNKEVTSSELGLDDLDEFVGGTTVYYKRFDSTWVAEFTCPNCGSKNADGIPEGTTFASKQDYIEAIKTTEMTCRDCGYKVTCGPGAWVSWRQ